MAEQNSGTNGKPPKAEPIIDEAAKKIILTDSPACEVIFNEEASLATRRPTEITPRDFTKALLVPILISCQGCEKSFPGPARFTELLMHLCSKQHSKGCAVPIEENPLYSYAVNHFSDSDNPEKSTEKPPAKKAKTANATTTQAAAKTKPNADETAAKENAAKKAEVDPQSSWIVCYICNIVASNESTYESHVAGKRHKSMLPHASEEERANPRGPYIVDGAPVIDISKDRKKIQPPIKQQPGQQQTMGPAMGGPGMGGPSGPGPRRGPGGWFQRRPGPGGFPPQMGGGEWDDGFGLAGGVNIPPPQGYGPRQNQHYDGFNSPRGYQGAGGRGGGGFNRGGGGGNGYPQGRYPPRNGPPQRYPNAQMDGGGYWQSADDEYYGGDEDFYGGPDYGGPPPPRGYRYENYGRIDLS